MMRILFGFILSLSLLLSAVSAAGSGARGVVIVIVEGSKEV